MVFQSSNRFNRTHTFQIGNCDINSTNEYKYLGNIINSSGKLLPSIKDLSNKGLKALFAIKKYSQDIQPFPVKAQCKLFDSLVKPILTYNSEIRYMDLYEKLLSAKTRADTNGKHFDYFPTLTSHCLNKYILSSVNIHWV